MSTSLYFTSVLFSFLAGMKNEVLFSYLIRYVYFMTSQFLRGENHTIFWFSLDHAGGLLFIFFCQVKESVSCNTSLADISASQNCRTQCPHNIATCKPPTWQSDKALQRLQWGKKSIQLAYCHIPWQMQSKTLMGIEWCDMGHCCQQLRCFHSDWQFLYLQLSWTSAE